MRNSMPVNQDNLSLTQQAVIDRVNSVLKLLGHDNLKLKSEGCCSPLTVLFLYHGKDWLKNKLADMYNICDKYIDEDDEDAITDNDKIAVINFAKEIGKLHDIHKYYPPMQQQDVDQIVPYVPSFSPNSALDRQYSFSLIMNREELRRALKNLVLNKGNMLLYIGDIYHCVGLVVKENKYYFYDANDSIPNSIGKEAKNIDDIVSFLYDTQFCKTYNGIDYDIHGYIGVSFDIFSENNKIDYKSNSELIDEILESNIDINDKKDMKGNTVLHLAAYNGHTDIITHITNIFPNININQQNAEGDTPVLLAAGRGHVNTVSALVEMNADLSIRPENNKNILIKAVASGNTELVSIVIGYLDRKNENLPDYINEKVADKKLITQYTLKRNYQEIFNILLQNNVDITMVDEDNWNVLHHVLSNRYFHGFIEPLLEHSDIVSIINAKDDYGETPLHNAIATDKPFIHIKALIKKGAEIDEKAKELAKDNKDAKLIAFLDNPQLYSSPVRSSLPIRQLVNRIEEETKHMNEKTISELSKIFKKNP